MQLRLVAKLKSMFSRGTLALLQASRPFMSAEDEWVENVCEYGDCPKVARRGDIEARDWHPEAPANERVILCDEHRNLLQGGGTVPPKPNSPSGRGYKTYGPRPGFKPGGDYSTRCAFGACALLHNHECFFCKRKVCDQHVRFPLSNATKTPACQGCSQQLNFNVPIGK